MTILITGAGGFVGQAATAALAARGHRVIAVDRQINPACYPPAVTALARDIADRNQMTVLFDAGVEAVLHLAAVPGGAAEGDPKLSRKVNLEATLDLIELAAEYGTAPRFVFSSTIAVLGDPLPANGVDDATPVRPRLVYGMHKAMIETALATMTRRGAIDGVAVRLPGIVARPSGASGMKSAFMSDVFHALRRGTAFDAPVAAGAQLWLMSLEQCVQNLMHALELDGRNMPDSRVVTLPALRVSMSELAKGIAARVQTNPAGVTYTPDAGLEAAFGAHPQLDAAAGNQAGFRDDGTLQELIDRALAAIDKTEAVPA